MVTVTLDGQQVTSPENWKATSAKISYDHDTQITSVDYSQEYVFTGDGFEYLYGKFKSGQECDIVNVRVIDCGREIVRGVIFITACRFNEKLCTATVKVEDDGYSARIQNNKGIKAALGSAESKNLLPITPCPTVQVFMFNQLTGGPLVSSTQRACYTVHDAFKWWIDWMTDGTVGFRSDVFNVGGAFYEDTVSSGINLRNADTTVVQGPSVTFRTFYNTWRKLRNIGMGFDRVNGQPVVRIEQIDHFRTSPNFIPLTSVDEVTVSFVQELLYSHIKAGSEVTEVQDCENDNCGAFVSTRYYGFSTDDFGLTGTCNLDTGFDLRLDSDVIVDGNTIQAICVDGDSSHDDKLVCIQRNTSTNAAVFSDPLDIGQYWYNDAYRNEEVLKRYQDYINGNISGFQLLPNLNLFLCTGSSPIGRLAPSVDYQLTLALAPLWTVFPPAGSIEFVNSSAFVQNAGSVIPRIQTGIQCFNANGRYNETNGRYTVEFDGAFRFQMQFSIEATTGTPTGQVTARASVLRYDSGDTLLQTISGVVWNDTTFNTTTFVPTSIYDSGFVAANANDYFTFIFEAQTTNVFSTDLRVLDAWVELVESRSVIETLQTNTPTKRLGVRRSFDYPVGTANAYGIVTDPTTQIQVDSRNVNTKGFIENAEINLVTGAAQFDIITNR